MFLKKNYGYLHCPHLLGAEFLLAKVNPSCFFFFSLKEKLKARSLKISTAKLTNPTWEIFARALNILKDRTWSFLEIGSCLCSIHSCPENRSRLVVNGSNRLKLNKKLVNANQTWRWFHKLFCTLTYLSRLAPNFYITKASQKLGVGREWFCVGPKPVSEIDSWSCDIEWWHILTAKNIFFLFFFFVPNNVMRPFV